MRSLKAVAEALHPLDWLETKTDQAVAALGSRAELRAAHLSLFGIVVVLTGLVVFATAGQNPALPGISEMFGKGSGCCRRPTQPAFGCAE